MIPIKDNMRSRRFPIVTLGLIVINIAVFVQELSLNQGQLNIFMQTYGIIPRKVAALTVGQPDIMGAVVPLVTAMFVHGGWLHVLGNMLYLWIFGDNVEDRLGRVKYLLFYITAGVIGSLAQIWANPLAAEPVIGASGAVAGVLGAYFLSYPRAKVLTLVPIFFIISFIEIPAFAFLIIWFILQSLNGIANLGVADNMVAWWAHIGGFLIGAIGAKILAPYDKYRIMNK